MARPQDTYEKLSSKAAEKLGLPDGFRPYSPFPFKGMNQQSGRMAIDDTELFYNENFIRIGDGNMRTAWDHSTAFYTAPVGKTIVYFFWFNIGAVSYCAVFLSDGTAVQVQWPTGIVTTISSIARTFYIGTQLPVGSQWGTLYLLIANNITVNSYWVWDGSILYQPGGLSPGVTITDGGSGYSSAPTVTAFGGSGSGITASAVVSDGSVVHVSIINPGTGFIPGDVVQFAFSGGGSDSSAILQAVLSPSTVGHVQLLAGGSGFTPGTYALVFSGGGAGSGAAGTYTVDSSDSVVSITLTSGGSGYTSTPAVAFSSGSGSGASGLVILNIGSVASVTVVNGGSGFASTPTLTFVGGGGINAAATAVLSGQAIASVTVTNGGSGYDAVPGIIVEAGVNNAAAAIGNLMPFGVSGSSMETFDQRVWLPYPNQVGNQQNAGTFLVSAPGSFTDFATSDGGLDYTSTDPFLRYQYTNIKQSNGYLYPIGDSSVDVISNVQTNGNPPDTTFNYQNVDPDVGTSWRDTVISFSRTVLMSNPFGVFGLYGGSLTKISDKVDNLFTNIVLPTAGGVTPCSAKANIFSKKIFLQLMTILDVYTGQPRNVMISWDEKEWFVTSQSVNLVYIGSQEVNSNITAWGTDGNSLYALFNAPSANLTKSLSTKLYGAEKGFVMKQAMSLYVQASDMTATGTGITFQTSTIDNEIGSFSTPNTVSFAAATPTTPVSSPIYASESGDTVGVNLGITLKSTSADFSLNNLILGCVDMVGLFGSTNLTAYTEE